MLDVVTKKKNKNRDPQARDSRIELVTSDLSLPLVKAIRDISTMLENNASCDDIATAAVQCTVSMIPSCSALILECENDRSIARVLAAANAPFVSRGDSLALTGKSVFDKALSQQFRCHHGNGDEAARLFPARQDFAPEPDDTVICKAIVRSQSQPLIFAAISDSDTVSQTESVLMTLSELMMALCTGHAATQLNMQNQIAIGKAKHEWEHTVDALHDLICLVDQNGLIIRANRTTERWQLRSVSDVRGLHMHELVHPGCESDDCTLALAIPPRSLSDNARTSQATIVSDERLDRILSIRTSINPRREHSRLSVGDASVVVVISDVTALHRATEDLSNLNDTLERRVVDRTQDLQAANRNLRLEIERRCTAEAALQASRDELVSLSQQLINAQEDERTRLSRELHDSIGQSLGAIKYTLERVASAGGRLTTDESTAALDTAIKGLTESIQDTRSIALRLRPPILDDMGAVAAIRWLVKRFSDTYANVAFHVEFSVTADGIPQRLTTPIYRIVQESLNNIVKHASAASALVSLRGDAETLVLEVVDDGIGFNSEGSDTGKFRKLGNFGRLGMRERASISNGILNISSAPGRGTTVRVEWTLTVDDLTWEQDDD